MAEQQPDKGRRCMLVAASTIAGGVATVAAGVPFVASMLPSERAKAAGAPVEADISKLMPGERMTVEWRGKPVWIVRRTPEMLDTLKKNVDKVSDPTSKKVMQPKYATNETRSIKPEYLVLVGICTHLGCSPVEKFEVKAETFASDWKGGFFCPCHGSLFDLAGRVYKNVPAPDNLVVPPHKFVAEGKIVIGIDESEKGAA